MSVTPRRDPQPMSIESTESERDLMPETMRQVTFEACAQFRASTADLVLCTCGWLEEDHGELAAVRVRRRQRRPPVTVPERKAS
jgi:hypothetical protein